LQQFRLKFCSGGIRSEVDSKLLPGDNYDAATQRMNMHNLSR